MINWWIETPYIDWMEAVVLAVVIILSLVVVLDKR